MDLFFSFLVAGGVSVISYILYRLFGGNPEAIHGGHDNQDEIDGYRNEKVVYNIQEKETGNLNDELFRKLKAKVRKYGGQAGTSVEYIGITSGPDPVTAMKSRVDAKKRNLGINCMVLLYETTSVDHCTEVERNLIDYSQQVHVLKNQNDIGGGGGRKPSAERYYVYAAYKR